MKYSVIYVPAAETMLTNIYLQASSGSDRQAVTAAANTIDQELAQDPETKGQSFGRFFILEIDFLSVL